jgi:hypothetical protein
VDTDHSSSDCHMDCIPSNFDISKLGIPFPRLEVFAQSLLDMNSKVDLTDLVDGMDLTEEWGERSLQLDGLVDVDWAEKKNQAIRDSVPLTKFSGLLELEIGPTKRRDIWQHIVTRKERRLGLKCSKDFFKTRYRTHNSADPREQYGQPPPPLEGLIPPELIEGIQD